MVSKLERERSALAAAEKELEERRQKLAELEREEAERELNRLIKKVGQDTAIALLELAVKVKPKVAISALEKLGGEARFLSSWAAMTTALSRQNSSAILPVAV